MFKGTVDFEASIRGNGVTFERFAFASNASGVEKVEIEGPNGDVIRATVHLASVASDGDGRVLANQVITAALDRIAFKYGVAIENAQKAGEHFSLLNAPPGDLGIVGIAACGTVGTLRAVHSIPAAELKRGLEQASPPGERNYGLLRSARQSTSSVEEFLHLYNIVRMICGDSEEKVDAFIITHEPAVPQTPRPRKPGKTETVYTRLRNEYGHVRKGVDLARTKTEMSNRLRGLISLTKQAIELNP